MQCDYREDPFAPPTGPVPSGGTAASPPANAIAHATDRFRWRDGRRAHFLQPIANRLSASIIAEEYEFDFPWRLSPAILDVLSVPHMVHSGLSFSPENGLCTILVYNDAMPITKHVRRSVSLPAPIAKQVDRMAKSQRLSDNRVLVELIELGIEARKQKEKAFFELAERFRAASDPAEAKRLGDEMGLMVFKDLMRKNEGKLKLSGCDE